MNFPASFSGACGVLAMSRSDRTIASVSVGIIPRSDDFPGARCGRAGRDHIHAVRLLVVWLLTAGMLLGAGPRVWSQTATHDVVVYGGTAAGVAAAVTTARLGGSVVLIEPTHRLGGLTSGGLGQTDIGNKRAIGGVSREFYERIWRHYQGSAAWKWQRPAEYRDSGQTRTATNETAMWTFEPGVALKVLNEMVREAGVPVIYGERLDLKNGIQKEGNRIVAIRMESGRTLRGKVFIDTTYEGDLMAEADVSYTVGREANGIYQETLNGVQTKQARFHQLLPGVDPYIRPRDPSSGLLPGIDPAGPGEEGQGDHRVQAYCFRMCLTDHPDNRIPFHKPDTYQELDYELLFRNFEAGEKGFPWIKSSMPNRKTDINNRAGFSTDFIGQNYDYAEGDYAMRQSMIERHRLYQQGLMWALANHPRVLDHIRKEVSRWGMCRDEFMEGNGWQEQIYVREARRMIGLHVMTQHHCQGRKVAEDPVGLAAYTMDSHHVQRYVDAKGHVQNEGDVQVGGFPPYPISYRSITPKEAECANLLVPVCLSASHIAFGSIRMEPVFMVLGQSAATAAVQAGRLGTSVQRIDYARLRQRLLQDKQVLAWTAPPGQPRQNVNALRLDGIVVDDNDAGVSRTGFETQSQAIGPYVGTGYRHDGDTNKGQQSIQFVPDLKLAKEYEVRLAYSANSNRASRVPVTIRYADGEKLVFINQRLKPPVDNLFISLGRYRFNEGRTGAVSVSNRDTDGHVIVDAVQFLP